MKGEPNGIDFEDSEQSLLEFHLERRNIEPGTKRNYRKAWNKLVEFTQREGYDILEIDESRAVEFCDYLIQDSSINDRTASTDVGCLSKMIQWCVSRGILDYNPFEMALEDSPFSYQSETVKPEIELKKLRASLQDAISPITLTLLVLLLKTGVRISEASNIDYNDIHLNHSINKEMPSPRQEVMNHPDSVYIDSSISEGEIHNGELRSDGNKNRSYRIIPIDSELKRTLVWYIAMSHPSPSDAKPLFRKYHQQIGERPTAKSLRETVFQPWAEENGWYGLGSSFDITPHWCRHWFTTVLRQRINSNELKVGTVDGYIKGLRGDTGSDVIETYTHDWGDSEWMRDAYIDNIPSLFPD